MVQPTEKEYFLCFDIQEGYTFRKEIVLMVPPSRNDSTDNVNVHKEVLLADPSTKTEMFILGWFVHKRLGIIWFLSLKIELAGMGGLWLIHEVNYVALKIPLDLFRPFKMAGRRFTAIISFMNRSVPLSWRGRKGGGSNAVK
jgi:hypothetical protein